MSGKVDTSLPGVEYDEEYEEVDVEHEMFSDEPDVIVSQKMREVEIFQRSSTIVAAERCGERVDYVSVYDCNKVSIEAVTKYFAQYSDWVVTYSKDGVDVEQGYEGDDL